MAHRRAPLLFKFVNVLILAILFAALATIYWFAWRPTAQTSGRIDAPVAASVSVVFDRLAVPHIRANGLDDALFAQGFVTAQERIFQMDLLRRYNAGELSEIFGPSMLETDRESRRLRLRRGAAAPPPPPPRAAAPPPPPRTPGANEYLPHHPGPPPGAILPPRARGPPPPRRLSPGSQRIPPDAPRQPAGGIQPRRIPATALERSGLASRVPLHVPVADDHFSR